MGYKYATNLTEFSLVRLTPSQKFLLQNEASRRGMKLTHYLRCAGLAAINK
jgi:hypothetical protein